MDQPLRATIVVLAVAALASNGCAVKNPFARKPQPAGTYNGVNQTSGSASNGNFSYSPAMGQRGPQPSQNAGGGVTSTIKQAGSSIASALTIKPRVIKADDPTDLSSNPGPLGPEVFLAAAKLQEDRGNFEKAKDQYRKALQRDPKNLKALLSYARIHDRSQDFAEAEKIYQRAISAHPREAIAYNDLGLCFARQGKTQAAAEMLSQAARRDPANPRYRNNLAIVLVERGQVEEAYNQLAAINDPAVAHYNIGVFLYRRDRMQEAMQQFSQAVQINPNLTAAQNMIRTLSSQPTLNRRSSLAVEDRTKPRPMRAVFEVPVPQSDDKDGDSDDDQVVEGGSSAESHAEESPPDLLPSSLENAKPIAASISDEVGSAVGDSEPTAPGEAIVAESHVTHATYKASDSSATNVDE